MKQTKGLSILSRIFSQHLATKKTFSLSIWGQSGAALAISPRTNETSDTFISQVWITVKVLKLFDEFYSQIHVVELMIFAQK